MSAGTEFHVCGAATENARRASSVCTLGTVSSGASDDRRGRAGTVVWIRSPRYAGVDDVMTLNVEMTLQVQHAISRPSKAEDINTRREHVGSDINWTNI